MLANNTNFIDSNSNQSPRSRNHRLFSTKSEDTNKNIYSMESYDKLICHYHPDNLLSNFCRSPNCLLPLCPLCISIHNDEHKYMRIPVEIDSIENIKTQFQKQLNEMLQNNLLQHENLNSLKNRIENHRNEALAELESAKKQTLNFVETYFNGLSDQINNYSTVENYIVNQQLLPKQFNVTKFNKKLNGKLNKLNENQKKLKTIIKLFDNTLQSQQQLLHNEVLNFCDTQYKKMFSYQFDSSRLFDINNILNMSNIIVNKDIYDQQLRTNPAFAANNVNNNVPAQNQFISSINEPLNNLNYNSQIIRNPLMGTSQIIPASKSQIIRNPSLGNSQFIHSNAPYSLNRSVRIGHNPHNVALRSPSMRSPSNRFPVSTIIPQTLTSPTLRQPSIPRQISSNNRFFTPNQTQPMPGNIVSLNKGSISHNSQKNNLIGSRIGSVRQSQSQIQIQQKV